MEVQIIIYFASKYTKVGALQKVKKKILSLMQLKVQRLVFWYKKGFFDTLKYNCSKWEVLMLCYKIFKFSLHLVSLNTEWLHIKSVIDLQRCSYTKVCTIYVYFLNTFM